MRPMQRIPQAPKASQSSSGFNTSVHRIPLLPGAGEEEAPPTPASHPAHGDSGGGARSSVRAYGAESPGSWDRGAVPELKGGPG